MQKLLSSLSSGVNKKLWPISEGNNVSASSMLMSSSVIRVNFFSSGLRLFYLSSSATNRRAWAIPTWPTVQIEPEWYEPLCPLRHNLEVLCKPNSWSLFQPVKLWGLFPLDLKGALTPIIAHVVKFRPNTQKPKMVGEDKGWSTKSKSGKSKKKKKRRDFIEDDNSPLLSSSYTIWCGTCMSVDFL